MLCPDIVVVPNGVAEKTGVSFNNSLVIHCFEGFQATGPGEYICSDHNGTGTWAPSLSTDISSYCSGL